MVHLPRYFNFSAPIAKNLPPLPPGITIRSTPTAGLGLFSTTAIPAGSLIYAELPILQVQHDDDDSLHNLIVSSLTASSPSSIRTFYSLHNSHQRWIPQRGWKLPCNPSPEVGIWLTNCIVLVESVSGVFDATSRINHSCVPNVEVEWCEEREMIGVFARRDIKAGEELVRTYFEHPVGHRMVDARRSYLAGGWAFECKCVRCENEAGYWRDKAENEKNRRATAMVRSERKARRFDPFLRVDSLEEFWERAVGKEEGPIELADEDEYQ